MAYKNSKKICPSQNNDTRAKLKQIASMQKETWDERKDLKVNNKMKRIKASDKK